VCVCEIERERERERERENLTDPKKLSFQKMPFKVLKEQEKETKGERAK